MVIELRDLRLFVAVVDHGGFRAAARAEHLTQPAISQRIRSLEETLGVTLIDRKRRTRNVTPAGIRLYDYAQKILRLEEEVRREMAVKPIEPTQVKMGTSYTYTLWQMLFPKLIRELRIQFPYIILKFEVGLSKDLLQEVQLGHIDLALVGREAHLPGVAMESLMEDELLPVVSSSHPWAEREEITLEELYSAELIVDQVGSAIRDLVEERLRMDGMKFPPILREVPNSEVALHEVAEGQGVTFISSIALDQIDQDIPLKPIRIQGFTTRRMLYLAYSIDHFAGSESRHELLRFIRQFVQGWSKVDAVSK